MTTPEPSPRYTYKDRYRLYQHLQDLSKEDCEIVIRILHHTGDPYTENSNGVFVDLERISDEGIKLLLIYFT